MKKIYLCSYLIISIGILLILSAIKPYDYFTWFLEVFPVIIGSIILIITYKRFKFTNLLYILIWIHAIVLIIGGHYTYAKMPLFDWIRDIFNLQRNYYDRFGHLMQGFTPALIGREIILRNDILNKRKWINFFIVSVCLAISSIYEIIEFIVAKCTRTAAESFLGTQGDIWDTQWDMLFALIGSILALSILTKYHDKQIEKMGK